MIKNIYNFNETQKMKILIELNEIIKTLFSNINITNNFDNIKIKTPLKKIRSSSKIFCI